MPHQPYKALYIHIPFCVKRCGYCDFATAAIPRDDKRIDEYVEQLVVDIRRQAKAGELAAVETVYIGGRAISASRAFPACCMRCRYRWT